MACCALGGASWGRRQHGPPAPRPATRRKDQRSASSQQRARCARTRAVHANSDTAAEASDTGARVSQLRARSARLHSQGGEREQRKEGWGNSRRLNGTRQGWERGQGKGGASKASKRPLSRHPALGMAHHRRPQHFKAAGRACTAVPCTDRAPATSGSLVSVSRQCSQCVLTYHFNPSRTTTVRRFPGQSAHLHTCSRLHSCLQSGAGTLHFLHFQWQHHVSHSSSADNRQPILGKPAARTC
jgi:hypothetical protein